MVAFWRVKRVGLIHRQPASHLDIDVIGLTLTVPNLTDSAACASG
jgi:hypothetical protein